MKYPKTSVITIKKGEDGKTPIDNPRREGTGAHDRFKLLKDGMTIEKFTEAGGRLRDIRHNVRDGHITLTIPEATVDETHSHELYQRAKRKPAKPKGKFRDGAFTGDMGKWLTLSEFRDGGDDPDKDDPMSVYKASASTVGNVGTGTWKTSPWEIITYKDGVKPAEPLAAEAGDGEAQQTDEGEAVPDEAERAGDAVTTAADEEEVAPDPGPNPAEQADIAANSLSEQAEAAVAAATA